MSEAQARRNGVRAVEREVMGDHPVDRDAAVPGISPCETNQRRENRTLERPAPCTQQVRGMDSAELLLPLWGSDGRSRACGGVAFRAYAPLIRPKPPWRGRVYRLFYKALMKWIKSPSS